MTTHRLPFRSEPVPAFDFSHLPFVVGADDSLVVEFPEVTVDLASIAVGPMSARLRGACPATVTMKLGARLQRTEIERLLPSAASDFVTLQRQLAEALSGHGPLVHLNLT